MAYIPGSIPVTGFIGPTDDSDTYAVTDSIYGIDGYRSLSSTTVRNAISTERRREGMLVYTQSDQNVWQLLPTPWVGTDADWKLFISSAASASLTAVTTVSNGLTKTDNNITLGGTLTGNTFINNAGFLFRSETFSADTISAQTIYAANIGGFSSLIFTSDIDMSGNTIQLSNIFGDIQSISANGGDIIIASDAYGVDITANAGLRVRNGINSDNRIALSSGATGISFGEGSGGVLNSLTTSSIRTWNLPDESGTIALLSNISSYGFLSLSGGTVTGDTYFTTALSATSFSAGSTTIASTKSINSSNGGGQLELDYFGAAGEVLLSTDNGAWSNESQLFLSNNAIELSTYDTGGTISLYGGFDSTIIGQIILGNSVDGVRIQRLFGSQKIELTDGVVGVFSDAGTIRLDVANSEILLKNNPTTNETSGTGNRQSAIFIGTENSFINSGVTNSLIAGGSGHTIVSGLTNIAVVGGKNISATTSNSLYTQNARLAENGGVIYSAGTDLYNIFQSAGAAILTASNGLTKSGNNVVLGGALTGNTFINNAGFLFRSDTFSADTISAQTIYASSTSGAQIIIPPVNASAPADGSMWFTTSGGTTYLNYRVTGTTKSVELT